MRGAFSLIELASRLQFLVIGDVVSGVLDSALYFFDGAFDVFAVLVVALKGKRRAAIGGSIFCNA